MPFTQVEMCSAMLPKEPCKLLTRRSLKICQGSGVGSIPIGHCIIQKKFRRLLVIHIFQLKTLPNPLSAANSSVFRSLFMACQASDADEISVVFCLFRFVRAGNYNA
jgi:hypothetical protein